MTSFSSAGSRSTSASFSSSSSRVDVGLELGGHRRELRVAASVVEVLARLPPLVGEALRRLELLEPPPRVGSLAVVVVDRRVGHALLRLRVGAVQLVDEALDRHRAQDVVARPGSPVRRVEGEAISPLREVRRA